jgi:ABC-2 type transport system ATP-binding protein
MEKAICLFGVSKIYRVPSLLPWKPSKRTNALTDVTFACPKGKITCLLGPNGAGKTTAIKILAGLIRPDAGNAEILGSPLDQYDPHFRRKISLVVANERSLYWRLTGRQNIDFFASLHGLSGKPKKRQVLEVLADVELEEEADKPVRFYSSGMKQRLILARALLGKPPIFLMDEPTNHLDPSAKARIHRFITGKLVAERRATILLCTNDLAESQELADHLVLINQGTVVAEGSLGELRASMKTGSRLKLQFARFPASGWEADLGITLAANNEDIFEFNITDDSIIPDVIAAAESGGGRLLSCHIVEPSLGEVFERLTGTK